MIVSAILFITIASFVAACSKIVPALESRIVGGFEIDISKAPYQVSIQNIRRQHYCGGSLIYPDIVLTAAHCFTNLPKPSNVIIYLGSTDRVEGGISIPARNIKCHKEYRSLPFHNDIALIRLSKAAPFSDKIRAIPVATRDPPPGTITLATGWGKLNERDSNYEVPKNLKGVHLKTIPIETCRAAYGAYLVQDENICSYTTGKDTCQGDSGGPLAADGILVGVVSWGFGCAQRGNPSVYTSTSRYKDWIAETISNL